MSWSHGENSLKRSDTRWLHGVSIEVSAIRRYTGVSKNQGPYYRPNIACSYDKDTYQKDPKLQKQPYNECGPLLMFG